MVSAPLGHHFGKVRRLVVNSSYAPRAWAYALGSFAILSLTFFLLPAPDADFPVEISIEAPL